MTCKKTLLVAGFLMMLGGTAVAAPASAPMPENNRSYTLVSDARDVVHDEASGTVIHSTSGACVRTKWMSPDDVCAPAGAPVAQVPPPPRPAAMQISREERTVYFAFNQATLSPAMKQRLDTLAAKLKSEQSVKGAHIVGYADRIGNAGYNEKLSKKRAETVRKYMVSRGIINTQVAETRWLGATTSITDCPNTLKKPKLVECLQGDRRVEVEIDYYPENVGQ